MTTLWAHQQEAVEKIAPLGSGGLFLDMGCGKTLAALELIERWNCERVLVLCPKSVVAVWPAEFRKHVQKPWHVLPLGQGKVDDRCTELREGFLHAGACEEPFAAVLNYEATIEGSEVRFNGRRCKAMEATLRTLPWDCIVFDESHRLKAPGGKASRLAARVAKAIPHRLALTGTPMPHSPLDIYAQYRAIDMSIFGTNFKRFQNTFAEFGPERTRYDGTGKWRDIIGYRDLDVLHARMYSIAYRARAEDVLDLPDTLDVQRHCLLEPTTMTAYHGLEQFLIAQVGEGIVTAQNALVRLLRLAQIANGSMHDDLTGTTTRIGNEKADLLRDVFAELRHDTGTGSEPEPVVVFGRFHDDLDVIHEVADASGLTSCELSGRRDDLAEWQAGQHDVIAVQLQSGGLGIDLTRARFCVYYSLDWSLGNYLQTRKRIHRPGQSRNVTYIHLLAAGTVDEDAIAALAAREEVVSYVVDKLRNTQQKAA